MNHDDDFDDGLVHNHSWATEPPIPPGRPGLKSPPDTAAIPTPSTAFHDDRMSH